MGTKGERVQMVKELKGVRHGCDMQDKGMSK